MAVRRQSYKSKGKLKYCRPWYVCFKDHLGSDRKVVGYTDKKLTDELERKLIRLAELRSLNHPPDAELAGWLESIDPKLKAKLAKWGMLDPRSVAEAKPLSVHLDDYFQALLDKGNTADHPNLVKARVERIINGCGFVFYPDIVPSKVQRFLADKRQGTESEKGISYETSNHYLTNFKAFCNWMVRDRRARENPVQHLQGMNAKLDPRHQRRNLTAAELTKLLTSTAAGPVRHRLTGHARAMLYRVAMETGFRRKELRVLTPADIDCGPPGGVPTITIRAKDVKNRKLTVQAVRPALATELKRWIDAEGIAPNAPLWADLTRNTAMMLRKDLEAAGIPTAMTRAGSPISTPCGIPTSRWSPRALRT